MFISLNLNSKMSQISEIGLIILLFSGFIGQVYRISADEPDDKIHCVGEDLVASHVIGEIQKNCTIDLHSTLENTSCIGLCVIQHLEGVDEKGLPTKEKFDKIVDEKITPSLRDKMKKTDCFDHVPKVQEGADVCDTLQEFEACFDKLLTNACKTSER